LDRLNTSPERIVNRLLFLTKLLSAFGLSRRRALGKVLDILRVFGFKCPRISVVVVNFNYGHYLIERLESILSQTIGIYEIILVDDASDDDSLQVLEQWMLKRKVNVTVIRNEQNSGSVFEQWKKGIEAASGDYVWIAEADDLSDPDFLETVLTPFLVDPAIVLSYCESRQMDGNGSFYADNYDFYLQHTSDRLWAYDRVADGISEITEPLAVLNSIPNVSAVLFNRNALIKTLQRFSEEIVTYKIAADYPFYVRLLLLGKVAYSRKNANIHRRHPNSIIARCHRKELYKEVVSVQQWVLERFSVDPSVIKKVHDYRDYMLKEIQSFS
jgi:O-antigen biosynthesis protein